MRYRRTKELPRWTGVLGALALCAGGCGSPAKNVLSDAAALESQGKLEEAAAKLEMGCALSPLAEPCPASDAKASETWVKAAEKAMTEGRYRDAERLFHRATLTADDAAKAKIRERIGGEDLQQGLMYERSLGLTDKASASAAMEKIAEGKAPSAVKAKEWLAKERPALLAAAVLAACGPEHDGSCTRTWDLLQSSGATGPDVDKAREAAEAEARRVYPLRVQAEGFLPIFLQRWKDKDEVAKCVSTMSDGESSNPEGDCALRVYGEGAPDERYDAQHNQDTLFRRTLKQIGDAQLTKDYEARRTAAEQSGNYSKLVVDKPKPAPKK